jgi:hypothetical protein
VFLAILFPTYSFRTYFFLGLWQLTREIRDYRRRQRKMGPVYFKVYSGVCAEDPDVPTNAIFMSFFFQRGNLSPLFFTCKCRRRWRNFHFCFVFFVCATKDCQPLHNISLWTLDLYCCMDSELRYVIWQWRTKYCLHETGVELSEYFWHFTAFSFKKYGSTSWNERATETKITLGPLKGRLSKLIWT